MPHIAFDTLTYAKRLKSVGFTEQQAEVQAQTLAELINEDLATKQDIRELEMATKRDLKELEMATKHDLKELEVSLKRDIKEMEMSLTIRLGSIVTVGIAVVATLVKLL